MTYIGFLTSRKVKKSFGSPSLYGMGLYLASRGSNQRPETSCARRMNQLVFFLLKLCLTFSQTTNLRLFQTESLQTSISNLMKMAESSQNR